MARKNLLKGLMDEAAEARKDTDQAETESNPAEKAPAPRYSKGAIGAVSKSIAELKSRSVIELDPFSIKPGGLSDRLEHDEPDHKALMRSIAEYGQQVPVLVRPDPEEDGKYQIVYGRRRVLALRDLGQPVKAMIRDLDDMALVIAQGQENSARRDLSFVERVNFARQMVDAGYDRKIIADALSTDKTLISRMLSVAEAVPVEVIEAIGSAPSIGRERWLGFARNWRESGLEPDDAFAQMASCPNPETSDARFDYLAAWLERRGTSPVSPSAPPAPRQVEVLKGADGRSMGKVSRKGDMLKIEVSASKAAGFDTWLAENIHQIHRDWQKRNQGE